MTFKETFDKVCDGTHYEQRNGIRIKGHITHDLDDMKLVERRTSDGRTALIIFFRTSIKQDNWMFWFPSENQMEMLKHAVPAMVMRVERKNEVYKE